jgi:hypothetical protein
VSVHDAPPAAWASALEKTLQARDAGTLRTPLKSHGYLFEIVIAEAARTGAMVMRDSDPGPARNVSGSAVAKAVVALEQRKRRNDDAA